MPQKYPSRPRAWGTRFDSLPSSPPPSPHSRESTAEDVADAAAATAVPVADASNKRTHDKMPHDASVFVGSLPINIEHHELGQLLSNHLTAHAQVKYVKVVRDTRGGACAFVQCEDAAAATDLLRTLHASEPKPFLGRVLRFEPARAFRALLISYRTPVQFVPANNAGSGPAGNYHQGETVNLELPFAMRMWRPRNSKSSSILYNGEAVEAANRTAASKGQLPDESFGDSVLHLQPMTFDVEILRTIAAHFGPLESFEPYQASRNEHDHIDAGNLGRDMPYPHVAPRLAAMASGCFEAKWSHRDDCVAALMTLRRVPHLTVTWAHQPTMYGYDRQSAYPNNRVLHQNVAPQAPHVQEQAYMDQVRATSAAPSTGPHETPSAVEGNDATAPSSSASASGDMPEALAGLSISEDVSAEGMDYPPQLPSLDDPCLSHDSTLVDGGGQVRTSTIDWTEDFPPLGDPKGERKLDTCGVWGEKKHQLLESEKQEEADGPPFKSVSLDTTPRVIAEVSGAPEDSHEDLLSYQDCGQELSMPPTPGLGMSPITPRTPSMMFPPTPTSDGGDFHITPFKGYDAHEKSMYMDEMSRIERVLDPTTLFVGGLEMFGPGAWDEEKVSNYFQKFGGLESVKLVRPASARASFAFVKFNNTESPARAVSEEHNRVHDGRTMRVQLRDCNPPRGSWRFNRGRGGRYPHHILASHSHRHYSGDVEEPSSNFAFRRDVSDNEDRDLSPTNEEPRAPLELVGHTEETQVKQTGDLSRGDLQPKTVASRQPSPEAPVAAVDAPSPTENYREWYDIPSSPTADTPPPSSLSPGGSFQPPGTSSVMPYQMPVGGYYGPPPPWVQPYNPQQMQYPASYMGGYPGYPLVQQGSQPFTSPGGSETHTPVPGASWQPMGVGMYGAYIPYPAYPPRAPNVDQPGGPQPQSQPPVVPTGFIQNEQGTLIAVYQPEALDQYMSTSNPPSANPAQTQSATTWPQPQPPVYNYSSQVPPRMNVPTGQFPPSQSQLGPGNMGWFPSSQSSVGLAPPQQQILRHSGSMQLPSAASFPRGQSDALMGQANTSTPFRRQPGRRDQHNPPNSNRNNNTRPASNRQPRRNVNSPGLIAHGEGQQHLGRNPQFSASSPVISGDWSQWPAGH